MASLLQRGRRTALAALLAVCAFPSQAASAGRDGVILHFVRTGLDGAEPEHIHVFRPGPDRLEVYKMRERCTSAALVIAEFDPARGEARRVVGGRLKRDGSQQPVASLTLDPATRRLSVRVDLPGQTLTEGETLGPAPLWLYDFDLADLVLGDEPRASRSVAFTWPDGGDDGFLISPGRADLTLVGAEVRQGLKVRRYRVGGPAFAGEAGGDLWVDAETGLLVEARLGRPNHAGYQGLSLRRADVTPADAETWRARLKAHFEGCPQ